MTDEPTTTPMGDEPVAAPEAPMVEPMAPEAPAAPEMTPPAEEPTQAPPAA